MMETIHWVVLPIASFAGLLIYLYSFLYRLLKPCLNQKILRYGCPLLLSGALLLPMMGFWPYSRLYSIALIHFVAFLLIFDLLHLILRKIWRGMPDFVKKLHRFGLIPLLITALVMVHGVHNIETIHRMEYSVETQKDIRNEGYRFALLADVHYGLLHNPERMEDLAKRVSDENVSAVILCGDVVDERSTKERMEEVFRILGGIQSEFGVFFVYGNHDLSPYTSHPNYTHEELLNAIESAGIRMLVDEAAVLSDDCILVGRQDNSSEHMDVDDLMANLSPEAYIVMADHQPVELQIKADAGVDLNLSGHTHAGQIFPVGAFCRLVGISELNYGRGEYGQMTAITTSGVTGWGYPMRTEKHSEYVIVDVQEK